MTAKKVSISQVINGRYVKEEGWEPNYIDYQGSKTFLLQKRRF